LPNYGTTFLRNYISTELKSTELNSFTCSGSRGWGVAVEETPRGSTGRFQRLQAAAEMKKTATDAL